MSRNPPKHHKGKKLRTAKGRKQSSTQWLKRQLNDPYVEKAQKAGYRSRAAFKILEIDEKIGILKPGQVVVDLGAAPGGWCQVAMQKNCARVVGIDLLEIDPLPGVDFVQMDFMDEAAPDTLKSMLNGKADVVLSDMAPNTTGHRQTDHLRIMAVVEAAYMFACEVLKPGGTFIAKVRQGGAQDTLVKDMQKAFRSVKHMKPPSSRSDSSEQFVIATGYRGAND